MRFPQTDSQPAEERHSALAGLGLPTANNRPLAYAALDPSLIWAQQFHEKQITR